MEFVLWFGIVLAAVALAGEHLFLVIFLAALAQFLITLGWVVASGYRRRRSTW